MVYILGAIILFILILLYAYIKQFANNYGIIKKTVLSFSIVLFTLAIILYPEESYNAAFDGIKTWFNIVCPSLLPFFIGSELLISLGIVNFTGILLEPVMRPLFNVPGCGSFPFVMSITSGYPVGSKIVAQLYNNKLCSKSEAQRLLSFCSTSGPLFMIGAVAVGMLSTKGSGFVIAISHYISALTVGIIFRFYKYKDRTIVLSNSHNIKRAFKALFESFSNENRPLGLLLSDAVKNSVNALLIIGGFIILFSVIIRLMILSGFINIFSNILYLIFLPFKIDGQLFNPMISGLFEITIGSKLIAATQAGLTQKIIAVCTIISWSGFSIHAQVASMISATDLKMSVYMFSKFLHALLSCIYAYLIITIWGIPTISETTFIFSQGIPVFVRNTSWTDLLTISSGRFVFTLLAFLSIIIIYIIISKLISLLNY